MPDYVSLIRRLLKDAAVTYKDKGVLSVCDGKTYILIERLWGDLGGDIGSGPLSLKHLKKSFDKQCG